MSLICDTSTLHLLQVKLEELISTAERMKENKGGNVVLEWLRWRLGFGDLLAKENQEIRHEIKEELVKEIEKIPLDVEILNNHQTALKKDCMCLSCVIPRAKLTNILEIKQSIEKVLGGSR